MKLLRSFNVTPGPRPSVKALRHIVSRVQIKSGVTERGRRTIAALGRDRALGAWRAAGAKEIVFGLASVRIFSLPFATHRSAATRLPPPEIPVNCRPMEDVKIKDARLEDSFHRPVI